MSIIKPALSVDFFDFYPDFNKQDNYFFIVLSERFHVKLSDQPEMVIFSCFKNDRSNDENGKYSKTNCVKFFYTGENVRLDFSTTDYAISFDYLLTNRNYRWPLYNLYYPPISRLVTMLKLAQNQEKSWDEEFFCCTVVSNSNANYRNKFFQRLSQKRFVASGGRFQNNVGGPVSDKLAFCSKYRFCLAFENSSYPGYTTEKLVQAKLAGSIPIYWGNPLVFKDFNPRSFINIHDFKNMDKAIEYVLRVESDQKLYREIQKEPLFDCQDIPK